MSDTVASCQGRVHRQIHPRQLKAIHAVWKTKKKMFSAASIVATVIVQSLQRLPALGACGREQTIVEANEHHIVLDVFLKMKTARQLNRVACPQWVTLERQLCARQDCRGELDHENGGDVPIDSRLVAGTSAASSRCTFALPLSRTYRFTSALASK